MSYVLGHMRKWLQNQFFLNSYIFIDCNYKYVTLNDNHW
jgi:hypothetical protein